MVDQIDVGIEVLVHGIEVHGGSIDRLIKRQEPAIDVGASNLGVDRDIGKGASGKEAIGWNAAEIAAIPEGKATQGASSRWASICSTASQVGLLKRPYWLKPVASPGA